MVDIVTYSGTKTKSRNGKHPRTYMVGRLKSKVGKDPSEGGYFVYVSKEASSRSGTGAGWAVALPKDPNNREGRNGVSFEECIKFFNRRVGFEAMRPAKKEMNEGKELPPHLAKLFDKNGDPKNKKAKEMWHKKYGRPARDVTPKGYGPDDVNEVSKELAGRYMKKSIKDLRARVADRRASGEEKDKLSTKVRDDDRKIMNRVFGQRDAKKRMDEMAPPGDKYERMVKHIKKGYSKDGKLTDKEKGIAYATAWKAKNMNEADVPTLSLEQIAAKHDVSLGTITKQLNMGIKVEMEHTTSREKAAEIARDHLAERPDYYTKLHKMEKQPVNEAEQYVIVVNYGHGRQALWPSTDKPQLYSKAAAQKIIDNRNKGTAGYIQKHVFMVPASKAVDSVADGSPAQRSLVKLLGEDAPVNATGAAVPGSGDTGEAYPKKKPSMVRRKQFAGQECFVVDSATYSSCIQGKRKYSHYKSYVGECETGQAIREYGRQNPGAPIIVMDEKTGAMSYLRYGGKWPK